MYLGNDKALFNLVFEIFDFNNDGIVTEEDLKIILNYLPIDLCNKNGSDAREAEINELVYNKAG